MMNFYRYYAGIDIGSSGIKIVLIKKQSHQWQLVDYQHYPINIPVTTPNAINPLTFLRQWRMTLPRGSCLTACLPSQLASQQQLPLTKPASLTAQALAGYVQQWLNRQATEQPLLADYQLVEQHDQLLLVITYLNQTICQQWQQLLQQQTLYLSNMTLSLFAFANCLRLLTLSASAVIIYRQTHHWLWLYRPSSRIYGNCCSIEDSPNYQLLQNHIVACCQQQLLPPPTSATVYYYAEETQTLATDGAATAPLVQTAVDSTRLSLVQQLIAIHPQFTPLADDYLLALGAALSGALK